MILFDIEADGLLDTVKKIFCIWTYNTDTKELAGYRPDEITECVQKLSEATHNKTYVSAFNGFGYDFPVLFKLYPTVFKPNHNYLTDELLRARLIFSDVYKQMDEDLIAKKKLPPSLGGAHSLKAWGKRLGVLKDEYEGGFDAFSEEMFEYCKQDVLVLKAVHAYLMKTAEMWANDESPCFKLEKSIRKIINGQENAGVYFDIPKALELTEELTNKRAELKLYLQEMFGTFYTKGALFVPKKDNKLYWADAPLTKVEAVEFNPGSRHHIVSRIKAKYGHTFEEVTDKGNVKIDDDILEKLPYPEAKKLAEYMLLCKRIAAVSTGDAAWLSLVDPVTSRISGKVNTQGTPTGRATHSAPNLAQIPAVRSAYGRQCRELFRAAPGKVLVGADLSGLELRCLGHYMYNYDDGEYIQELLNGDIHTKVQTLVGLPTRDAAKTLSYALIYGAGDGKLGKLVGGGKEEGEDIRAKYMKGIKGFDRLCADVQMVAKRRKALMGPDGRLMPVRAEYAALNLLLQGCGGIISKRAILEIHKLLRDTFKIYPYVQQVLWVHDEVVFETYEEHAETVGKACIQGFEQAGKELNIKCPITGEWHVGATWADIH